MSAHEVELRFLVAEDAAERVRAVAQAVGATRSAIARRAIDLGVDVLEQEVREPRRPSRAALRKARLKGGR